MKIIFLDFDGVMDTAYYDHILSKDGLDGCRFNEHQLSRLLVVNPFTGLDEEIAERAIAILNREVKP